MKKIKTYLCYDPIKQAKEAQTIAQELASFPSVELIPFERSAKKYPAALLEAELYIIVMGKVTKTKKAIHRPQLETIALSSKPVIGVNVNGMRGLDSEALPALLKNRGLFMVTSHPKALARAISLWPDFWEKHDLSTTKGVFRFTNDYYDRIAQSIPESEENS